MSEVQSAGALELLGAGAFGAVIGWILFFLNRHRADDIQLADLVTIIGALGGGAILALFPAESELFGAYGIGLFAGFFGYLGVLGVLASGSENFDRDYFIDGRRVPPLRGHEAGGGKRGAMGSGDGDGDGGRESEAGGGDTVAH